VSEPTLDERIAALEQAVTLAGARVSIPQVAEAGAVGERTRARLGHGTHHAVVAIAGPTGGGKSSLFNQLAGGELSPPGLRRPTTAAASAAVWGPDVEPLLRWLEIGRAHPAPNQAVGDGASDPLDGLVLVDLPDHDSIERSHQLEMERLTDLADLLLWVTDPQKYADASVHAYLRNLAGQDAAIVVVLNQIDLLTPAELDTCLSELTSILRADGLAHVVVHPVSAATGTGLEQLEVRLADVVSSRRAAVDRAILTVSAAARDLDRALELDIAASSGKGDLDRLISELAAAAGADAAGEAIAASHRRMAALRTGWPVTRWISAVRRDPLRTLRSASQPATPAVEAGDATTNGSEPQPEGWSVDQARIRAAVRTYVEQAVPSDSPTWQAVGRKAANQHGETLARTAQGTVAEVTLEPTPLPRWWKLASFVQRLAGIAALAGLGWLVAIAALEWAKVPQLPIPEVGDIPVPTALLLGGVLVGVLTAWISRGFAGVGAKRRAARARSRIEAAVTDVADELVVTPIDAELADLRRLDQLLEVAGT
jgi:GTP-binding protein EngB required for normal cell division